MFLFFLFLLLQLNASSNLFEGIKYSIKKQYALSTNFPLLPVFGFVSLVSRNFPSVPVGFASLLMFMRMLLKTHLEAQEQG